MSYSFYYSLRNDEDFIIVEDDVEYNGVASTDSLVVIILLSFFI